MYNHRGGAIVQSEQKQLTPEVWFHLSGETQERNLRAPRTGVQSHLPERLALWHCPEVVPMQIMPLRSLSVLLRVTLLKLCLSGR